MQGATHPHDIMQRSRGDARVCFVRREAQIRLAGLSQSGAARVMLPRAHGDRPEAVFLNTSGGVTDGDRLSYGVEVGPGARAVAATQTAERGYAVRSPGPAGDGDCATGTGKGQAGKPAARRVPPIGPAAPDPDATCAGAMTGAAGQAGVVQGPPRQAGAMQPHAGRAETGPHGGLHGGHHGAPHRGAHEGVQHRPHGAAHGGAHQEADTEGRTGWHEASHIGKPEGRHGALRGGAHEGRHGPEPVHERSGRMEVRLDLAAGAELDWLPQETILYQGAAIVRHTCVTMAGDARLVMVESVVMGRAAMGETLRDARLHDRREVWRDGRLILLEPFWIGPDILSGSPSAAGDPQGPAPRRALLGPARAVASVALVAPGAEDAVAPVRAVLPAGSMADPQGVEAGASGWDGRCLVRLAALDGLALRRAVIAVLAVLRGGRPLPRVWQV